MVGGVGTYAAMRKLLFSNKGHPARHELTIRVHLPREVEPGSVNFKVSPGTAHCRVEFSGLDEPPYDAYGADTLQALSFAINVDPILKQLSATYDFFYDNGDPYFDDDEGA